jgi:hypothetical protein
LKNNYDVAICYRIYPKISKIPPIYPDDKFKLSELCLASLVKSLDGIKAKWFVILDNCPPEYREMFGKYLNSDAEYIETNVQNNGKTFGMQMDILLNQNYSDKIYFAEDDYFYIPGNFLKMLKAIEQPDFDFITPYDHLDYYHLEFHNRKYYIKFIEGNHWRSCGSTTMTFLTTKLMLSRTESTFRTYIRKNYDSSLWMTLTRDNVNSPFRFFKLIGKEKLALKIFAKAWIYTPLQTLFGKKYKLYTPVPSFAQHLDNQCMAPGIDWDKKFEEGKQWLIK